MSGFARMDYPAEKGALYALIEGQAKALLEGETNPVANMANISALLNVALKEINWVGFYMLNGEELVLGPFQGKPACIRIPLGKGVCSAAVKTRKALLVPDVDAFPGHIACDGASRSELVVPLIAGDTLLGVLDIDSPLLGRFDEEDKAGLSKIARLVAEGCHW